MPVEIVPLTPEDARRDRRRLERLYLGAFSPPPYREGRQQATAFGALLDRDSRRPGFQGFVARRDGEDGEPLGIVYGYSTPTRPPDGIWWERLLEAIGPQGLPWVLGQFAFCWFAVDPRAQGMGLGRVLHDTLLDRAGTPRSWLVTHGEPSLARSMYERRGWVELGRAELGWLPGERRVYGIDLQGRVAAPKSLRFPSPLERWQSG